VYTYIAYGLAVSSEFPLAELTTTTHSSDVTIRRGHVDNLPSKVHESGCWFHTSPQKTYLVWDGIGVIKIQNGCEIIVDPEEGVEEGVLHQAIQGTAFGLLLHQRGLFPLHASAVLIDDQAVAFAGKAGRGKSTLASVFHSRGYPLISDDITAVAMKGRSLLTAPGFPMIKLWPDSMATYGDPADKHYPLHAGTEKILIPKVNGFVHSPHPLKRIYILEKDNPEGIDTMPSHKALLEVIKNCYCSKLIQASIGAQAHMRNSARLVNHTKVYYLNIHWSLQDLSDVVQMIEKHLEQDE